MKKLNLGNTWVILLAGLLAALALFSYAESIPLYSRVRGDAYGYLAIAEKFSSFSDAFFYSGNRTNGFPFFLYFVRTMASPISIDDWVAAASYAQFLLHIIACISFYAVFLKENFKKADLPTITAPLVTAMLMAYPVLVCYTSIQLTDTFCVDLLMIAATLHLASRNGSTMLLFIQCAMCGLLLGYVILVRPSFWPPIVAFYGVSFLEVATNSKDRRSRLIQTTIMVAATLTLVLPYLENNRISRGTLSLQNPEFAQEMVSRSMQTGLSAVRVFWSSKYISHDSSPGVRDPFLEENYAKQCQVDSAYSLARCLFTKPQAIPLYFGKKIIALFDEPHLQPYAVDLTPFWFIPIQRLFEIAALCGFVALIISTVSRPFLEVKPVWIGLPWASWVLALMLMHSFLHVEGRYGFPAIPFSIASLCLGYAGARQVGSRFYTIWLSIMIVSALLFLYQIYSWDSVLPV